MRVRVRVGGSTLSKVRSEQLGELRISSAWSKAKGFLAPASQT